MQALVHPKSHKASARHVRLDLPRPALAARYEPSSRILALLLGAAEGHPSREQTILFCAFTPDFKQLQSQTREVHVQDPCHCEIGPEGAPVLCGELPFVLLPAVADSEGSGAASKVCILSRHIVLLPKSLLPGH